MELFFTGAIIPVTLSYVPTGWALCNGQLMQVSQNVALFSLLGSQYGGDGKTTFALPDLCGRTAIGMGAVAMPTVTSSVVTLGEVVGETAQLPALSGSAIAHIAEANLPLVTVRGTVAGASLSVQSTLNATSNGPGAPIPSAGAMLSGTGSSGSVYYSNPTPATPLPSVALSMASIGTTFDGPASVTAQIGSGAALTAPVAIAAPTSATYPMQPSLALNYIICLQGIYPERWS